MKLMIDDYVIVTKYSDRDNNDPWRVGFLAEIAVDKKGKLFRIRHNGRYYRHCKKISGKQGQLILEGAIINEILGVKK